MKRPIPFLTCSLYLDPVCREAILSRRHPVKNFAFGTCLLRQVSLWGVWRARPLGDGQTGNKKRATCLATLPQNKLNSVVVRFLTHIKPVLQQIRLLTGLTDVGGETRNIVASFYASFSRSPLLIAFSRPFIPPFSYPYSQSIKDDVIN